MENIDVKANNAQSKKDKRDALLIEIESEVSDALEEVADLGKSYINPRVISLLTRICMKKIKTL